MATIIRYLIMMKEILQQRINLFKKYHKLDHKYSCYEELVLDCGLEMAVQPLPSNIEKGQPQMCYWNCQQLVFTNPTLTYVEGFVFLEDTGITINHAWLLTEDHQAVDPTTNHQGHHYFGVPFSTEWLRVFLKSRHQRKYQDYLSIFENNYLEKFSLLKDGLPTHAIKTSLIQV
jgi:hypothetical protein